MGGGAAGGFDDQRVRPGEAIWRLIQINWYLPDPNIPGSKNKIQEHAFSGDLSVLRHTLVSEKLVDSAHNRIFTKFGILELNADDIRKAGLVFEYEHDSEWGQDAHFLLRRVGQDSKLQRLNNTQKKTLADLANQKSLVREPKP
jgi:hypothetical protein